MAKIFITKEQYRNVAEIVRSLTMGGWETPRLLVPKRGHAIVRALGVCANGARDVCVEVFLDATRLGSFKEKMVRVHCAERFGVGSGQTWSYNRERELPMPGRATVFLSKRLGRASASRKGE